MAERQASQLTCSLVIPAYNEEARLGKSLERIFAFFESQPYSFEIIVVDDGSVDKTVELIRERFAPRPQLRIHQQPVRRGKGAAVQVGMLRAEGDYLFFSDADLSVPIELLPTFLAELQNQCDIAIGSRQKAGAKIEIHQPFLRELMGKVFTALSNLILSLRHSDLTCGFKGFGREAAQQLFSRQRLHNWSFDAEILYLAKINGYRVHEVPVTWRNDAATRVRLSRDVVSSFLALLIIRLNHYLGRYNS